MEDMEILEETINILKESLEFSENLRFKMDFSPNLETKRIPDAIIQIKISRKIKGQLEEVKNSGKESVEGKLIGKKFVVEVRRSTEPRFLRSGISYLKEIKENYPELNPLLVGPFIGPRARELCRNENISYIDTIGNIGIFLKEGFIIKESDKSIRREKKELKSLFSPKASRVIRIILENTSQCWHYKELSATSKVSLGQTYNVVKKLIDEEYVEKTKKGIKVSKPSELLERWSSIYKITEINKIESFYLGENIYGKIIERVADIAEKGKFTYAFTLFAGSNFIIPYVRTPHVHLYLLGNIEEFAKKSNIKPVTSGGNLHLILPYDEGVFNPIQTIEGVRIVGKIQLYLDLSNYPARGKEQAEVLKEKIIGF